MQGVNLWIETTEVTELIEFGGELVIGLPSAVRNKGLSGKAFCQVCRYQYIQETGQNTELILEIIRLSFKVNY